MPTYSAYGLTFASDLELPELPLSSGEPQVSARCAPVAAAAGAVYSPSGRAFRATPQGILLDWGDYARFLVCQGHEILVEPVPGAPASVIRHLLLGPVFSALLFQRGMSIFHASAVQTGAGGLVFMGGKGYGKSTLAAAFLQQGGQIITDDLLALQPTPSGLMAAPGVPFLKLWPQAVAHLGGDPDRLPLVKDNLDKRTLPLPAKLAGEPVPLRAVILLDHGPQVEVQRCSTRDDLRRILPHWYGSLFDGELLPVLGAERQFWDCTSLAQRVPVFLLRRPVALERLPETCQAILCAL